LRHTVQSIKDYVWVNDAQKAQVEGWIADRNIPNLLLSGGPGIGKTTLAKCLFHELNVDDMDIKYINASNETKIENLRSLMGFIETMPMGEFRYVLLDEADYLSHNSQAMLRNMMEEYSNICRWILTCNYPEQGDTSAAFQDAGIPYRALRPRAVRRAHRHDLDRRGH